MPSAHLSDSFRNGLHAFAHELEGIEAGDVEALHRARVASRRLRELLPLVGLDRDVTSILARRLRKVTKQLGPVRELDVLMLLIQELAQDSRYPVMALTRLRVTAVPTAAAARDRLAAKLPMARLERLARKLERVAKSIESDNAGSDRRGANGRSRVRLWALEVRLVKRAARVRAAIDAAGAVYVPERLHGVRIAVKKLRYAAELAADTRRKRIAADVEALKGAQDVLGRLHDLEVLLIRAREAQASLSPPNLATWRDLDALVHAVEDDCRQLHARYMRDRTDLIAITNRMRAGAREAQPVVRRTAG